MSKVGFIEKAIGLIKGEGARITAKPAEATDAVEQRLRNALANDPAALADLGVLLSERDRVYQNAHLWPHVRSYNNDISAVLGASCPAPTYFLHTSWSYGTPWGDILNSKLGDVFVPFEESLIELIEKEAVAGAVLEFGVYQGFMLNKLISKAESIGAKRNFFGFDSFEGLSEPSKTNDHEGWHKGQYAAGYDMVAANLKLHQRPNLKLIKGWVEDSLTTPDALAINPIAYARIDVDIYDPTVDCLRYLSNRMADGSILAFDDWAYSSEKGESKAFFDWVPTVPHLKFEWLGQCSSRVYFRVRHR